MSFGVGLCKMRGIVTSAGATEVPTVYTPRASQQTTDGERRKNILLRCIYSCDSRNSLLVQSAARRHLVVLVQYPRLLSTTTKRLLDLSASAVFLTPRSAECGIVYCAACAGMPVCLLEYDVGWRPSRIFSAPVEVQGCAFSRRAGYRRALNL